MSCEHRYAEHQKFEIRNNEPGFVRWKECMKCGSRVELGFTKEPKTEK